MSGLSRTRCPYCRKRLEEGQRIHPECIDDYAEAQAAKAERKKAKETRAAARVQKTEDRKRRESFKKMPRLIATTQCAVNKYVRLRDKDDGCVSCDKPATWHGQWHAGHFRSVGAAKSIRFHLWNIHKQCSQCNNFLSGNIANYTPRIIAKIGKDKVDWLMTQNNFVRYDVDYLERLKSVIKRKKDRLEKRGTRI